MSKRHAPGGGADQFALIAGGKPVEREKTLTEPEPPPPRGISLPVEAADGRHFFDPLPLRHSWDDVRADRDALKQRLAPFLRRLAPPLPRERPRRELKTFSWRVAQEDDHRNFCGVLAGEGRWETVRVPHFGEPLGRATTYYRREFELPPSVTAPGAVFLCFEGVDYKAHVFVNGDHRGSHEGFFAPFEFDITSALRSGTNTVVVKVENDAIQMGNQSWCDSGEQGDKIYAATGPGYDDPAVGWHHCPPGMGISQRVYIEARSPLHFHDLFIRPLRGEETLEITFEVWNCNRHDAPAEITFSLFGRNFASVVCRDQKLENHNPAGPGVNFYRVTLHVPGLRDWEPDAPWLYELQAVLRAPDGHLLDAASRHFGVRSFLIDETSSPKGRMFLNGREIRLRGANTMGHEQQCVMRGDFDQLLDDLLLAKACHMNFLRLTQRPVQKTVYEYADMVGLLLQTDLPFFGVVRRNSVSEAIRQAGEMERLVRNSPANILVTYINEPFVNARDKPERHLQRTEMHRFFECADRIVRLENPDRMIKHVEGDYDPPCDSLPDNHCYNTWYNGHGLDIGKLHRGFWQAVKPGWMYGCGEFGAEGLDDESLMCRKYPQDWLPGTPQAEADWSPHSIVRAQTANIHYMWFETPARLAGWIAASRKHQAWGVRLMTEAFRRDNHMVSFAVHLFIDAFPAGWMKAIMDCERRPKPAYFAYRDACAPLLLSLRCDRDRFFSGEPIPMEIWICNDSHHLHEKTRLAWRFLVDGSVTAGGSTQATVPAVKALCQGVATFPAPKVGKITPVVLEAALLDQNGKTLQSTAQTVHIHPLRPDLNTIRAGIVGPPDGRAARLARELGLQILDDIHSAAVILVDDVEAYTPHEDAISQTVRQGARCLFLGLKPGGHHLAGDLISVTACGMNSTHFASRDTGHPVVEGLEADDVKFWFDEDLGYVSPFLHATFQADGWEPILRSGNGVWGAGAWQPTLAAASKTDGSGTWIICQTDLHNRVRTNPVAAQLACRMIRGNLV